MSSASSSTLADSVTSSFTPVSRGPTMSTALVPVPLQCNSFPKHGTLVPNRIFIGGLSASVTEDELGSLFARYGHVRTVKIILDRVGLSKGYGFVTFDSEEEVQQLLKIVSTQVIVLKDRKLNIAPAVRKQGIGRSLESLTSPLSPAYPAYYNSMPYLHPVTSPAVSPAVASSPSVSVVNSPTTPSVPLSVAAQPDAQIATSSPSGAANAVPSQAVASGDVNMAAAYYATPTGPARSTPYPYVYAPPVYFQQYPYTAPQWAPGTQWQWLSGYRQASPVTQYVYFGNALAGTAVVSDPGTGQAAFVTSSTPPNAVGPAYTNVVPVEQSHQEGVSAASGSSNNQTGDQGMGEPAVQYSHHGQYYLHASEPLLTAPRAALCTPPSVSVHAAPSAPPRRASSQRWSHESTQWNDVPWKGGGGDIRGGGVRLRDFSPDGDRRRRQAPDSYSWAHHSHSSDQLAHLGSISSPRLSSARKLVFSPASSHSSLNLSLNDTLSCPEQVTMNNNPPLNRHCTIQSKRRLVLDQQSPSRLNRDRHMAASASPGACLSQAPHVPITPPTTPIDSNEITKQVRL